MFSTTEFLIPFLPFPEMAGNTNFISQFHVNKR